MLGGNFWEFNIGNVGTIVTIVSILWQLHKTNVKKIEEQLRDSEEAKNKLDHVYHWILSNGQELLDMKTSVSYMIRWFERNVVGLDELPKKRKPSEGD